MMQDQLVVVITGASRGIGNALAQAYLSRPSCTVVGTVRDDGAPGVAELNSSSKGEGSKLLLVKVDSSSHKDASSFGEKLTAAGIDHIDILIANAGTSTPAKPLEAVGLEDVTTVFNVNAVGPLALYQACHAFLKRSDNAKFVTISSSAGSIGLMKTLGTHVTPAYGISKAALNWITSSAHCGNTWLTAFAVQPGLTGTDMGNRTAKFLGLEKAPQTKEQCAEKIMTLTENASRETISGKFLDITNGKELPW